MYARHDEIPALSTWPDQIEALHYNLVQRALTRVGHAIRLELPGLKTLDLILQTDAWIIVDRAFNDIPVAAWADMQPAEARGLHEPVACELRYFHGHAGMITKRVLELMDDVLREQLSDGDESHQVIAFPSQEDQEQDENS